MAITSEVTVTMFILMKTVIFICRGRNTGVANAETGTNRDTQGQTGTDRERQGNAGTGRDIPWH